MLPAWGSPRNLPKSLRRERCRNYVAATKRLMSRGSWTNSMECTHPSVILSLGWTLGPGGAWNRSWWLRRGLTSNCRGVGEGSNDNRIQIWSFYTFQKMEFLSIGKMVPGLKRSNKGYRTCPRTYPGVQRKNLKAWRERQQLYLSSLLFLINLLSGTYC